MNLTTSAPASLWMSCKQCNSPTQHHVLRSQSETGSTEEIDWYRLELQIVRCNHCNKVCFKQSAWNAHDRPFDSFADEEQAKAQERRGERGPCVDEWELPDRVRTLYKETLLGFNAMAMTISASGLRAVVEEVCREQACTGSTVEARVQGLVGQGAILKRDADRLRRLRFMGDQAGLGLETPPREELEIALQVLEHLLISLYVLPRLDLKLRRLRARDVKVH